MSFNVDNPFSQYNALGTQKFKEKMKKRKEVWKDCPICCEINRKEDKFCSQCGIKLF